MEHPQPFPKKPAYQKLAYMLITITIVATAMMWAKILFLPLVLGGLFAFLLYPLAARFEKWGIPRVFAIILCILIVVVVVAGIVLLISFQVSRFLEDLPGMQQKLANKLNEFVEWVAGFGAMEQQEVRRFLTTRVQEIAHGQGAQRLMGKAFMATSSTIATLGLLPVYIFFLLFYREKFRIFILRIVGDDERLKAETIMDSVQGVSRHYIIGVMLVIMILAVLNSIAFSVIGIQHAVLLGILAAMLDIIPYFGPLIGGTIPFAVAMLTEDSLAKPLAVVAVVMVIQFIESNLLTPLITGSKVSINPIATILALLIGASIWGVAGMIIFVPLMGILKVIFDHVDSLNPYGYLIGTEGGIKEGVNQYKIINWIKGRKGVDADKHSKKNKEGTRSTNTPHEGF